MQRIASQSGICQAKSEACTYEMNEQCGCDGVTYANPCLAAAAGVNIASAGACRTRTSTSCTYYGVGSDTCANGQYCFINTGLCMQRIASQSGVCEAQREFCTADYTPQCGCDGNTYSNECLAANAGVNIAYAGECRV